MSSWSRNRKFLITTVFFFFCLALFGTIYTIFFYKEPNCFDEIKNGREDGIDCGGVCELVCPFSTALPQVFWARAFEIETGVYNIAGLVENPNFDVKAKVVYLFQIYNDENILIEEFFGDIELYPNEKRTIFEPAVNTGFQKIGRVFLKVVEVPIWTKSEQRTKTLVVKSRLLEDTDTVPKLQVSLTNTSISPERDVIVTVVLTDRDENVHQVSRTYLEYIERGSTETVFFTWPKPFDKEIVKIDVYTDNAR